MCKSYAESNKLKNLGPDLDFAEAKSKKTTDFSRHWAEPFVILYNSVLQFYKGGAGPQETMHAHGLCT